MKSVLSAAFVFCLAMTGAKAETLSARDKAIAVAAPDILAALSQPMTALQDEGYAGLSADEFRLGLAMFAGRLQTVGLSDEDVALLKAMEMRAVPLASTYLQKNPDAKPTRKEWKRILKATSKEMAMVDRFQKRFMGDFWLARAAFKLKVTRVERLARPTVSSLAEGGFTPAGSMTYGEGDARYEINRARFVTAGHCVSAVRKAVGLRYVRSAELPVSIRFLWDYAPMDYQGDIERHVKQGTIKGFEDLAVGAAACGDEAQFKAYVEALKASTAAPSN